MAGLETLTRPAPGGRPHAERESGIRGRWFADHAAAETLELGFANTTEQYEQAFSLVHDQYVAHGYMGQHPRNWRLSPQNALPSTKVFVASAGGRVVGTLTLVPDSPLGLPMDEIYHAEVDGLRDEGRRMAEVSALAIAPDWRQAGVAVMMRLVRMMVLYAAEVAGLDDLVIAVNPTHVAFYRRGLHFRPLGGLRQYRKVNGAPAIALRLDLSLVRALISELRQGHPMTHPVYRFMFSPESLEVVVPELVRTLPRSSLTAEQLEYFFGDEQGILGAVQDHWCSLESFFEAMGFAALGRTLADLLGNLLNPEPELRPAPA